MNDKDFSDSRNKRLWAQVYRYLAFVPFVVVPAFFILVELFLFLIYPGGVALPLYVGLIVVAVCFFTAAIYLSFQHMRSYFKIDEEKITVSLGVFMRKTKNIYFTSFKDISLERDSAMTDLFDVLIVLDSDEIFKLEEFVEEDAQKIKEFLLSKISKPSEPEA